MVSQAELEPEVLQGEWPMDPAIQAIYESRRFQKAWGFMMLRIQRGMRKPRNRRWRKMVIRTQRNHGQFFRCGDYDH